MNHESRHKYYGFHNICIFSIRYHESFSPLEQTEDKTQDGNISQTSHEMQ
jgi:hypothetical protein